MNIYYGLRIEDQEEFEALEKKTALTKEQETQKLFREAYGDDLKGMHRSRVFTENINYLNNPNF